MAADFSGKSDPYCVLQGDCLIESACTEFEVQTLDPSWDPKTLPSVRVRALPFLH